MTTGTFASLLIAVNTLCVCCDKLLLSTQREKFKRHLEAFTTKLKTLDAYNAPAFVLDTAQSSLRRLFGESFNRSPLFWVTISALSIFFTTQSLPIDAWLTKGVPYQPLGAVDDFSPAWSATFVAINLAIDLAVWAIFLFFLSDECWRARPARALKVAGITVVMLYFVAEKRYGIFYSFVQGFHLRNFYLGERIFETEHNPYMAFQMFGAFFPFAMFLSLSVLSVLAIPFLRLSIVVGRRLTQPLTEVPADRLAPFTFIGSFVSVIAAALKFLSDYAKGN